MIQQKVLTEFGRRGRKLDFKVMKGEEFRNLVLFFWDFVILSIENGLQERKLWLVYTFQVRAYVLPDEEYKNVSQNELAICNEKFLFLFEAVYGISNASYNIHMMCHLKEIRSQGKLTDTSTFAQESYYGEMRNSYVTGTCSTGKQIITNAYIKRQLPHNSCRKRILYRAKETSRTCDRYFYIHANGTYKFYAIKKENEDGTLVCTRIGKRLYNPPETIAENLSWNTIGVFKFSTFTENEIIIKRSEVTGKAIIVNNIIMTCPTNVLQE